MLVVCRGFSDPVECGSSSLDFGDDLFGGLVPDEWFRVVAPVLAAIVVPFWGIFGRGFGEEVDQLPGSGRSGHRTRACNTTYIIA